MNAPSLQIRIHETGNLIATRCQQAPSMRARMIGLLNHDHLNDGEGLLLEPCNHVHSFFMRFAIDVVFLDRENRVLAWQELPTWRLSRLHWRARKVLELPAGTCLLRGLQVGHRLEFQCSN